MGKQYLNGVVYGGFPTLGAREDYTCDLLYENTDFSVASGTANVEHTYTLTASIDNYDAVQVLAYGYNHTNGSREQIGSHIVMKPEYYRTNPTNANSNAVFYVVNASVVSSTNRRFGFRFSSNTVINTWASRMDSEEPKLYKVYGIKFGTYHKYSTTEQVVGTWIDGKPLYEITKVFTHDTAWDGKRVSVAHGISNIDKPIECMIKFYNQTNGALLSNANVRSSDNRYTNDAAYLAAGLLLCFQAFTSSEFVFIIGNDFISANIPIDLVVTFQYTKTTD